MDLISVIVPLYNKEQWVLRCILSVIKQTYKNVEILIINDGSTDGSRDMVSSIDDSRIKIYDKPNGGLSTARNYGIAKSKGKYIALIDADDEWASKHLEYMLKGFEQSQEIILVCNDLIETADGIKENGLKRNLPFASPDADSAIHYYLIEDYIKTLKEGYFLLSGSSVLIDTEIIKKYDLLFLPDSEPSEDINYWLRLNQLGKFVFCDYVGLFYHREDTNSIMNKKTKIAKLVPPFFYDIDFDKYDRKEKSTIKKFLSREYYKKAYQNRGIPLKKEELSTTVGSGVQIGKLSTLVYLAIRYCPQCIFSLYKKFKSISGRN